MAGIGWTEKMSVGVPEIDRQHQRLIELFNNLDEGLVRGSAARIIRGLFAELSSYTKYHFNSESNQLRIEASEGLAEHLSQHDEFTEKVDGLAPLLQREGSEAAALEASRFLRAWILRHIFVVDRLAFARIRKKQTGDWGSLAGVMPARASVENSDAAPGDSPAATDDAAMAAAVERDADAALAEAGVATTASVTTGPGGGAPVAEAAPGGEAVDGSAAAQPAQSATAPSA